MHGYVADLVATGDYPQLSAMVDDHGLEAVWEQMESAMHATQTASDRNLTDGRKQDRTVLFSPIGWWRGGAGG